MDNIHIYQAHIVIQLVICCYNILLASLFLKLLSGRTFRVLYYFLDVELSNLIKSNHFIILNNY